MKHAIAALWVCGLLSLMAGLSGCGGGSSSTPAPQPPASSEYLYCANVNQISAFRVSKNGALSGSSNITGPNDPGGILADSSGKSLYVSDFTGSAIDGFGINGTSGVLTAINGSPFPVGNGNGPAGMAMDSAGKFLFLAHANDSIYVFARDADTGALTVPGSSFAAGAMPMKVVVHPTHDFLYASDYNDQLGGISAYTFDPTTGALTEIPGSPFLTQSNWPGPSGIVIEPSGKFLYVGLAGVVNANHYVVGFSIDAGSGALTPLPSSPFATGNGPLEIALYPSGKYLYAANFHDSTISAFAIDSSTGALNPVSGSPFPTGTDPFALAIDPNGSFLYTANQGTNNISAFSINSNNGVLTQISGSPFGVAAQPLRLAIVKLP